MTNPSDPQVTIKELQRKIQTLLDDFSNGKLNKEQFNTVYARYNGQLRLIEEAVAAGSQNAAEAAHDNKHTAMLLRERAGRVLGLRVFLARTNSILETIGDFSAAPPARVQQYVNQMFMMMEAKQPLTRHVEKINDARYVVFCSAKHTVVAALFANEPAPRQVQELIRMHRDFEDANRAFFHANRVDANSLAYPFLAPIQNRRSSE